MSIVHYISAKIIALISVPIATAFAILDPTTKGYVIAGCIAAIPPTITGMFNHVKIGQVARRVDGINTRLRDDKEAAVSQLADTSKQLSHAEGRREGIESTEVKPPDTCKLE